MKKFTFVLAATALCVNVGFAHTLKSLNRSEITPSQLTLKKVEAPFLVKDVKRQNAASHFDFVKVNQRSTAQVATLTAPEALPATNVTENSFTANWNEVSGANYYQVEVYRNFKTETDLPYYVLYEDFAGMTANPTPYTGYLDDYCYRWDWYLLDGELGDQAVVFPQDVADGSMLYSPYCNLEAGGNGASTTTIYMGITAEGIVGDSLSIGFCYIDELTNQEMAYSVGKVAFTESEMSGIYQIGGFPLYEREGFMLFTTGQNTGDVKIKSFVVLQPVAAGSDFTVLHDYRSIPGTSASFILPERDVETAGVTDDFFYGVYAMTVDLQQQEITDVSQISNLIDVTGSSAVEGVQVSHDKIFVHDNLHVVLEKPATVNVYNMAGVLVMSVDGVEGENEIALPASGVYIVKAGNTVAKVMK